MDPPDSLNADAKATMNEYWNGMSNDDKLKLAQKYDAALAEENAAQKYPLSLRVPKHLDPLNETTGLDYRLTQGVAKKLFVDRATQIVKERGIGQQNTYAKALHEADADKPLPITEDQIRDRDDELWRGWVDSSTSDAGLELQVAIAEELGGRLLTKTEGGGYMTIDPDAIKKEVDEHPGGYALVKALVRAKWETTQWMLERAGIKRLNLYRTISLPFAEPPKTTEVPAGPNDEEHRGIEPFRRASGDDRRYAGRDVHAQSLGVHFTPCVVERDRSWLARLPPTSCGRPRRSSLAAGTSRPGRGKHAEKRRIGPTDFPTGERHGVARSCHNCVLIRRRSSEAEPKAKGDVLVNVPAFSERG